MIKPVSKTITLVLCSAFLLAASQYSSAINMCSEAYQWTPTGYFKFYDLVRYKGSIYYQNSIVRTRGLQPDLHPNEWTYVSYCYGHSLVSCDFNGDGQLDTARGYPDADLTGGLLSYTENQLRENANLIDIGEVTITYNDDNTTFPPKPVDVIWTQNDLGMHPYAKRYASFGYTLSAGDFNNDSFCDLAIGAPGFSYDPKHIDKGLINLLYGSPNGLGITVLGSNGRPINPYDAQRFDQDSPNVPETAESRDQFGDTMVKGDFNGDGYDDLAVGAPGEGVVLVPQLGEVKEAGFFHVFYGSRIGIQTSNPGSVGYFQHISGVPLFETEKDDRYGDSIAAEDFDRDGYTDLIVAAVGEDSGKGKISVFRGSPVGLDVTSRKDITESMLKPGPVTRINRFGESMFIYDENGDGFPDLEVYALIGDQLIIYIIPGSASGLLPENFWIRQLTCTNSGCN